jgi:hypothetical protein
MILAALLALATPCQAQDAVPSSRTQAASAWRAAGLGPVEGTRFDALYARPGADFAAYTRVWIRPVVVALDADAARRDAERIEARTAALVRDALVRELGRGGYALAEGPGDGVLEVRLSIIDAHLVAPDAPDAPTAGRTEVYVPSAGAMTVVMELRDAATGEVVGRAFDRRQDRETARPMQVAAIAGVAHARAAARAWASALRRALDALRKPSP